MFELREPKFRWGQRVAALIDLYNDGSHPEVPLDALLVAEGAAHGPPVTGGETVPVTSSTGDQIRM